jgi:allantoate deiminase
MIANESPLDGARITERLHALAAFTDGPGTLTRLTLSPAHAAALRHVEGLFRAAGLATRVDALGTVRGVYAGARPDAPTLLIGSHIDSVRDGGIYDGDLGVMLGLAVVEDLARQGRRLPFAVEVLAFGDEEGVRFPSSMSSSRALAGKLAPTTFTETDADGVSRGDALRALGFDPDGAAAERIDPAKTIGYLEVHIEQGPVLEAEGLPLGVVTGIQGTSRATITVRGLAGHAGTLPMDMRADALACAAEMVLAIEHAARSEPELRATVGRLDVRNGSVNVVPGEVTFSLDTRSHDDALRLACIELIAWRLDAIAAARGCTVELEVVYDQPAAPCDPSLQDALTRAIERAGETPFRLASGAGHDAMSFKDVIPHAMLFVRCKDGISHNPAEYCSPEDIGLAARVLADAVAALAGRTSSSPPAA